MAVNVARRTSQQLKTKLLKQAPPYYEALLSHPPQGTVTRSQTPRPDSDLPVELRSSSPRPRKKVKQDLRPKPIVWAEEDLIRSTFLKDHPWERARPISVTEGKTLAEGWIGADAGQAWKELAQRSRNPSVDEYVPLSC